MTKWLRYIFVALALMGGFILAMLVFSSSSPDPSKIKVFGIICFIGLLGSAIIAMIELINKKGM